MEQTTARVVDEATQKPGVRTIGRRCEVRTEDGIIVVVADGAVVMSFPQDDVAARRLAMVLLSERQLGSHDHIAAAFGLESIAVDRARKDYRLHGLQGLMPKRRGPSGPRVTGGKTDVAILAGKRVGQSNVTIGSRLGISEGSVRAALRRLGWRAPQAEPLPFLDSIPVEEAQDELAQAGARVDADAPLSEPMVEKADAAAATADTSVPAEFTADMDPAERSIDRLLAVQGMLQDAAPLFGEAQGARDVGVLLAIPVLVTQGVVYDAIRSFHPIGPAFYGLRSTIVCVALLMMLNLCRPQHVMQREPRSLGRLIGLDRVPEVKTLRRKLNVLALQKKSLSWMDKLARRQLSQSDQDPIWVYLDGHVSVYSGEQSLREHHVTRLRTSCPSVLDYWVNQPNGDPLMVVTGAPKESMVEVISTVIDKVRALAPGKRLTLVFDREGWSPLLFARLAQIPGVYFLTYRKASPSKRLPRLPTADFRDQTWQSDGRTFIYPLADKRVRISYIDGRRKRVAELRQITRLKKDGKQTHVMTNDFDSPAAQLAHRMFSRWTQENYFKYGAEHRDIDALVSHHMEPADGSRLVANPQRAPFDKELARLKGELQTINEHYGRVRFASNPPPSAGEETYAALASQLEAKIARCQARRDALPAKVPWNTTDKGKDAVQPQVEHRRLMHVFRMVAHRAETALLELLRPHFADWRHEGRALVRQILHSSGDLSVTDSHLNVTIDPLASPYKTRALAALCEEINQLDIAFPGSSLKLSFRVRPERSVS